MKFADLFSGCGGFSHAFYKDESFQHIFACDSWDIAKNTYIENYKSASCETLDLYDQENVASVCRKLVESDCELILGGPPCQGFSTLGKRALGDCRDSLATTFLRIVKECRPKVAIMENVRGITSKNSFADGNITRHIYEMLEANSLYNINFFVLEGVKYGLAQTRTRWFMLATNKKWDKKQIVIRKILSSIEKQSSNTQLSLYDVIGDLPPVDVGCKDDPVYIDKNGNKIVIRNHIPLNHGKQLQERLAHVPAGGGLLDVPVELLTPHLRKMVDGKYGSGGHVKNIYGRLSWDKPCGTIVAGMDKITCGRFVHPDKHRLLTPRECARIQSFPDDFKFLGGLVAQYYLIGNAVPPRFSQVIASAVSSAI